MTQPTNNLRERAAGPLDTHLEELLSTSIRTPPPPGLVERTMARLPGNQAAPFPWWAWMAYAAFFLATIGGLLAWQGPALGTALTQIALLLPKAIALAARHPGLALAVAGAFLLDGVLAWFLAAEFVLRRRVLNP